MEAVTNRNKLLFLGSIITLVSSLLAAFIPNIAYVIVVGYQGMPMPELGPHVYYPSLNLNAHMYTLRFVVVAFAAMLGIFSLLVPKSKRIYPVFQALFLAI